MTTSAILRAVRLRALQEAQQRGMRLRLREAVQIEARIDRLAAARDTLLEPPPERRERRRLFRRRLFRRASRGARRATAARRGARLSSPADRLLGSAASRARCAAA